MMTRIAVTADVHLRSRGEHPERFNALRDVMEKTHSLGIGALIIAGDLFDKNFQSYSEFEALCREFPDLHLYIIPGNHDPGLQGRHIVSSNATIYSKPSSVELGSRPFLFLPYTDGKTMGEVIADMGWKPSTEPWALVGHGDFLGGTREPNPLEPGVYMPLLRADLQRFQPRVVLLGHIHDPPSHPTVHYPGSPCSLNISETGRRSFLVVDTEGWDVSSHPIDTDVLFFRETLVLVPHEQEAPRLRATVRERIRAWGISPSERDKVRIRVEASGYVRDRSAVAAVLEEEFSDFTFHKDEGPNYDRLSVSVDIQLNAIAEKVRASIQELEFSFGGDEPTEEDALHCALELIYSER